MEWDKHMDAMGPRGLKPAAAFRGDFTPSSVVLGP